MQNVKIGQIVRSISGHDKNELYIVFKIENNFAFLSNGKSRKTEFLKKKNKKHIIKVGENLEIKTLIENNKVDNSQIIKILKDYR